MHPAQSSHSVILLVTLSALAGCGARSAEPADQSLADGVQALCDMPFHLSDSDDPLERVKAAGVWADHHVQNPEARRAGDFANDSPGGKRHLQAELATAVAKAHIEHCKLLDNGYELQSFAEGITVLCNQPELTGEPAAKWLKTHLLNPEVIRRVFTVSVADQPDVIRAAVASEHLSGCPLLDRMP